MASATPSPVSSFLDRRGLSGPQLLIVGLVLVALLIDGVDLQTLALVAPVILKQWNISRAIFGPAMGAALVGMAIGASVGGWLGDRYGRKTILVLSVVAFAVATMLTALSRGIADLTILRFVCGLGFGATAPNGIALSTEWLPHRARSPVVALLSMTIPLGGLVGTAVVLGLLPSYGWRGCFVVCGAAALLIALLLLLLPESASFLVSKGRRAQAEQLMRRFAAGDLGVAPNPSRPETTASREDMPGAGRIFAPQFRRLNLGVWIGFFGINFTAYALAAWTPVYLTMSGFSLAQAVQVSFANSFAAVAGAILTAFFIARLGSRGPLIICCVGTFACICALAATVFAAHGGVTLPIRAASAIACGGAGGFNGAAIACMYALLSFAYPTACRATGVGFGIMMGRLGGVAATLSGGAILTLNGTDTLPFFGTLASCSAAAFCGMFIIDRHMPAAAGRR